MAVNLTDLSLPQLEGLKNQLDQEVEFLTSSITQLKVAQTKFVEAKDSLNVLSKNNKGKKLLVPLTSSMYVPGTLNDVEHVLVDVGTGYYVEKNVGDSKKFFKRKIDFLTKQIEKVQPALQEKHSMKQGKPRNIFNRQTFVLHFSCIFYLYICHRLYGKMSDIMAPEK
ncbi:prefoldin subunit 5 isoform X1 [Hippoglossus hippoglossus]|uniref:prefoldin subunit 5 isoform X1 n=1 Tax=Hippoglossus hippoglossus TaxID=8267 RepID=UPI00148DF5F4|nr:prefoldin subunit 5 isoform X1 [Hippoglossus hippoglossus]